jgi:hypothetical protein
LALQVDTTRLRYLDRAGTVQSGLPSLTEADSTFPLVEDLLFQSRLDETARRRVEAFRETRAAFYATIGDAGALRAMFSELRRASGRGGPSAGAVDSLNQGLDDPAMLPDDFFDRFETFADANGGRLSSRSAELLGDIAWFGFQWQNQAEEAEGSAARLTTGVANVVDALTDRLGVFYVEQAAVVLDQVVWKSHAHISALRIGTSYGFTAVGLSPGQNPGLDAVGNITLRFYFGPVDKDLPSPYTYPTIRSRFALLMGTDFSSEVRYEGEAQADLFGGLKPMVGLGYDVNRFLGVDAGLIFYRQPTLNPLDDAAVGDPRASPYLGLSFDFNIFNRLQGLTDG